ncbi:FIST C-terminal domain-containing protein, partial [Candidatus Berkelbacteria bacterium]|nr:FIST C-terminal domain-containing protein [Candidatus Berkelbacteria bacterium]
TDCGATAGRTIRRSDSKRFGHSFYERILGRVTLGSIAKVVKENILIDETIAQKIVDQAGGIPKAFLMLPDGLAGNGSDIVAGVLAVVGDMPFVGGSAGDDFLFKKTYQYFGKEVVSGTIVAIGITGDVHFGIGVRHGWKPIGVAKKVTKAEGNVLHEIEGKPAISIYEEQFGVKADVLRKEPLARLAITYPLGMKVAGSDEYLIRDPIQADEHGAITCAAAIPVGADIQLMLGGVDEAIEAGRAGARQARENLGDFTPKAILNFNCIARDRLYALRGGEEIKAMLEEIGPGTPFLGFYTYGEQAPIGGTMKTCNPGFHNETSVLWVLGE